jgi:alpha-tubulin suppressor-like RCC1 family protein
MDFFIKQNATLPVLKMQVVKDGRSDYMRFMESLEISSIFFTMVDVGTGIPKIVSAPCEIVSIMLPDGATPEYYIYFKFKKRDTNTPGRFQGQFLIKNYEGNLILPLREELYINIQESFISDESCCEKDNNIIPPCPSCPACPDPTSTPTLTPTPTSELNVTPTNTPTQTPTNTPTQTPTNTPTTTQTSTLSNIIFEQCNCLLNLEGGNLYQYDVSSNGYTYLTNLQVSADVAMTTDKLWIYSGTNISEYNITLSPWTISYNRNIVISPIYFLGGIVSKNNNTLLAGGTSIWELDITTNIAGETKLFDLPIYDGSECYVTGDIFYSSSTNNLIIAYQNGINQYIGKFTYDGTLLVEQTVTVEAPYIYSIFYQYGILYVVDYVSKVYSVNSDTLELTYVKTVPTPEDISIFGAAQPYFCDTPLPTPTLTTTPTSTSTTTPTPTSTSTTTPTPTSTSTTTPTPTQTLTQTSTQTPTPTPTMTNIPTEFLAYSWGGNSLGQLGNNTTIDTSTPIAVFGGIYFVQISSTFTHTLGLTKNGVAYAWGKNQYGQLGDNTTIDKSIPTIVAGGLLFQSISAGNFHSLGLTTTGKLYSWGWNVLGQLGTSGYTNRSTPTAVFNGDNFIKISAGGEHSLAIRNDNVGFGWGNNGYGEIGDNTTILRNTPTTIFGGLFFSELEAGNDFSLGITTNGVSYSWGSNTVGQLGDGTIINRSVPVVVFGNPNFVKIAAGGLHSIGLDSSGNAYSWGLNNKGQLGDNSQINRCSPVAVSGGLSFNQIGAGIEFSLAIYQTNPINGQAYAWGNNEFGQLGNNTSGLLTHKSTPVAVVGFSGSYYRITGGLNFTVALTIP